MGSTGIARGFCCPSSINSPASPSSSRHRHLLSSTLDLNSHHSSIKRALHSLLPKPRAESRCPSRIQSIKATGLSSLPLKKNPAEEEEAMTITTSVRISDEKLIIKGRTILTGVPDNVTSSSAASSGPVDGIFLGAQFDKFDSRHVIPLGTLRDIRFLSIFRFKLWWMSQKMGNQGKDIPVETQFLLLESKGDDDGIMYIVFLPLIEGPFRACLQGNSCDEIELCLESGDVDVKENTFSHSVYIGASDSDPFAAISDAVRAAKSHLKTFRHRTEKKLPSIVDYFGWCTWDAFYQEVTQEGVEDGLSSLTSNNTPPKFIIIDDGWQSTASDENSDTGSSLQRLTGIKENSKFQNKDDPGSGIQSIVSVAKETYGLKYVYVWHAITGYWGGVRPGVKGMEEYGARMQYPNVSPGVMKNEPWMKTDVLTLQGLGLVNPKGVYKFYNDLHGYLAKCGVDGVKVDVQCVLETLGAGHGGRVELTQQYHQALDASVGRNFPDNGCIACMSHNTDALYCSKQTAVVRASDDFYPRDPVSHTIHIASVAYNSVFLGEFMLPDWDMFHSLHPAAEYHASARAISGGPIYVSLLKIWNMNKYTGVLGIYNCQGAAWSSTKKKNVFHHAGTEALSCALKASDVHLISAATDENWNGDCVVYHHEDSELVVLPHDAALPVSLKVLEHGIFTVSPIKVLEHGYMFAPLGLIDMYNAGGAIEGLSYQVESSEERLQKDSSLASKLNEVSFQSLNKYDETVARICIEVKGCGRFGAYSSAKPKKCSLGSSGTDFSYDSCSGLLTLLLDNMPENEQNLHQIIVEL